MKTESQIVAGVDGAPARFLVQKPEAAALGLLFKPWERKVVFAAPRVFAQKIFHGKPAGRK